MRLPFWTGRHAGEKGRDHSHHEIKLVLSEQLFYKRALQRLDLLLIHGAPPVR